MSMIKFMTIFVSFEVTFCKRSWRSEFTVEQLLNSMQLQLFKRSMISRSNLKVSKKKNAFPGFRVDVNIKRPINNCKLIHISNKFNSKLNLHVICFLFQLLTWALFGIFMSRLLTRKLRKLFYPQKNLFFYVYSFSLFTFRLAYINLCFFLAKSLNEEGWGLT